MADLSQYTDYNAEPPRDFDPVPAGQYIAEITDAEVVDTKTGGGKRFKLTWKILDGPFTNRLVFDGLNIVNSNITAQTIAQGQMKELREAMGRPAARDTDEYKFVPHLINVGIKPASGNFSASNSFKGAKPIAQAGGGAPAAPAPAPAQSGGWTPPPPQQAATAAAGSAPWKRG